MAGVLDALASYIQNMLTEMARDEVQMLLGVSGEIEKMDIKLKDLKNFLADADRRNITDQSVQAWVRELRDAMYEATNILDLCQLKAMERGRSHDAGCLNPLLFCMRNPLHAHKIGSRMKNLNQRLDEIKTRSSGFGFKLGPPEDHSRRGASSRSASRETSGLLDESSLVGEKIEEDTRNLVEMLTAENLTKNGNNRIVVFSIVGVGGIGKTTLAQKIYNHDIIQQEFPKRIWLSVNKDFGEIELLRRVIIEAGGDHQSTGNARTALEKALKNALNGQKTLLVMDDVWDHRAWEDVLKTPLSNAVPSHGCCILVTTRNVAVARGMMAKKPYHHVDKLEPQDAWLLLKKQVHGNENDEAHVELLKDIGMKIVEKCDCLPLAVKVMGGLLRQKSTSRRDWENVLNDSMWSVSQMPEELNNAIYLSYQDMHACLKPCFLHYSLLPKRTLFYDDAIVGMWISEGFIHGTSRDLEEIGKGYYEELMQRNLIEPDLTYVDQSVCSMHDVVRSFAQYVVKNEALVAQNSEIDISEKFNSQKFIRLSVLQVTEGLESRELDWCSLQAQPSLRTLILVGRIKIKPGDSLLAFSNLRTLHVENASIDELAKSLSRLKHLRYLCIDRTSVSRLPVNIGKMKFLQHISLSSCKSLSKLPASISKLQQLRYLNLSGTCIKYIRRGFDGLTSLRKLYGFPAHVDGGWCSLEELGPLSHLMDLGISGLENVSSSLFATKTRLAEKTCLTNLSLECSSWLDQDGQLVIGEEEGASEKVQRQIEEVFDELCPPSSLEKLGVYGYFGQRLPRWMTSAVVSLQSLRILMMCNLACCTELPNGLCQLPCLEFVQITNAAAIKCVGSEFLQPNHRSHNHSNVGALFPRLSQLYFIGLVEWEEQVKAMPILEKLHLENCMLRHLPACLAFHATALKRLCVYDVQHLSYLENFTSVVHLYVRGNKDMERISNLPRLQNLTIVECPKVKVLEGMPALKRLNLEDYDMKTVPRYLQDANPRHLLLDCSLSLLTCIAAGKSGPEWDKFSHVQQVKVYADDEGNSRKWYVLYTRDPFCFETNIGRSAIARARIKRMCFPYSETCPVGDECPLGRHASTADKRLPLCLRFRCNAYRHLAVWLCQACLHCSEALDIASSSEQWTEAAGYHAAWSYQTTYGRLQEQKGISSV